MSTKSIAERRNLYKDRPLIKWADLTPENAVFGNRVEFKDRLDRTVIGFIKCPFPGYISVSPLEIEGLSADSVVGAPVMGIKWPTATGWRP